MLRASLSHFNAAPAAAVKAAPSKMQVLHNILIGTTQFKGKALVKECNVAAAFGATWQTELSEYAKSLKAEEKTVLDRQIARLNLTRYTTRELADFAAQGADGVDAAAKAYNVKNGVTLLTRDGEAKFTEFVKVEAANANWSEVQVKSYIAEVKAAKK